MFAAAAPSGTAASIDRLEDAEGPSADADEPTAADNAARASATGQPFDAMQVDEETRAKVCRTAPRGSAAGLSAARVDAHVNAVYPEGRVPCSLYGRMVDQQHALIWK